MHGLGEQVGIKAGGAAKVSYMTLACGLGGCGPRPLLPPRWPHCPVLPPPPFPLLAGGVWGHGLWAGRRKAEELCVNCSVLIVVVVPCVP